jgi:hypothetical protein
VEDYANGNLTQNSYYNEKKKISHFHIHSLSTASAQAQLKLEKKALAEIFIKKKMVVQLKGSALLCR